jgi:transposase, IS5 family
LHGKRKQAAKIPAILLEKKHMYKAKDRKTLCLFEELFPFGGKLDEENRWLKIAKLIPWNQLESKYEGYFSHTGRPATDGRLAVGLFLLKHMSGKSDEEVVLELLENPYWQVFCGLEGFATKATIEASTLSRLRKRLGTRYVKEMEDATYGVLIEKKIIKAKGMLADGTVIPENIKYPNDVGLLNDVREWLVKNIRWIGSEVGKRYRTYCRVGRKAYLNFAKCKRKTKKLVRRAKRKMLGYVRRNLRQIEEVLEAVKNCGSRHVITIRGKLKTAQKIFRQQLEMHVQRSCRINERIVSFHRPWVRPIKRGKNGKDVEFGAKAAMSHVDGFLFLDAINHDNFSEAETSVVKNQIEKYEERFGRKPSSFTGDKAYGSRTNRKLIEDELGIRTSFVRLGKRQNGTQRIDQWFKRKQKERNRIEGHLGHGKEHYRLNRMWYHGRSGSEIWTRYGILAMNLKTALARV